MAETRTYGTVHMPTAHMCTDGCEALSACEADARWNAFEALMHARRDSLHCAIPKFRGFLEVHVSRDSPEMQREICETEILCVSEI